MLLLGVDADGQRLCRGVSSVTFVLGLSSSGRQVALCRSWCNNASVLEPSVGPWHIQSGFTGTDGSHRRFGNASLRFQLPPPPRPHRFPVLLPHSVMHRAQPVRLCHSCTRCRSSLCTTPVSSAPCVPSYQSERPLRARDGSFIRLWFRDRFRFCLLPGSLRLE